MSEKYISGLVSVIMPTYKRSEKLIRAIESVLSQTYSNIELLLVNDNKPEDEYTADLKKRVEKYDCDRRFNLIIQDKHINGAVARNVGIRQAKGEYIAFLDDDDWWKSDKIEKQVAVLKELSEEWGGVSCRIEQYDGEKIIARLPKYADGNVYKDILMLKSDFATGTLMLRHTALDNSGYFDESLLRHQDLQLMVDFTYKYKLFQLDELLHCCDVSDTMNRPDAEKLIKFKKAFFESVKPVMDTMTKSEKRCIFCVNKFEIGYVFLKNRQYLKGFKYCFSVVGSFKAFVLIAKKIISKLQSRIK